MKNEIRSLAVGSWQGNHPAWRPTLSSELSYAWFHPTCWYRLAPAMPTIKQTPFFNSSSQTFSTVFILRIPAEILWCQKYTNSCDRAISLHWELLATAHTMCSLTCISDYILIRMYPLRSDWERERLRMYLTPVCIYLSIELCPLTLWHLVRLHKYDIATTLTILILYYCVIMINEYKRCFYLLNDFELMVWDGCVIII